MKPLMRLAAVSIFVSFASVAVATEKIAILDDCDPADPGWNPTGGCLLKDGDVSFAEFNALLDSMLSTAVIGHPAWRIEPSYVRIEPGERLRVTNQGGGRLHTFTEVATYGGGRVPVPALNEGLTMAPECAPIPNDPAELAPGEVLELRGLSAGNYRFQCCIHPWMRALVKVEPKH
jgi:plastocyanin